MKAVLPELEAIEVAGASHGSSIKVSAKALVGFLKGTLPGLTRVVPKALPLAWPLPEIEPTYIADDSLGPIQSESFPFAQLPSPLSVSLSVALASESPSEWSGQAAASDPSGDRSAEASIVIMATGCLQSYVSGGNPPHP